MRKVLILSLALILTLGMMSHGTSSYFSDTESLSATFCCWTTECEDSCGSHYIVLVDHTFDDTNSTWTYEVTSGSSPALSHWVLEWCDCSAVVAIYENGVLLPYGVGGWECGEDPTTLVTGIKIDRNYDDGETKTVVIVLAGDYPLGRVVVGMKDDGNINICEACGPVCELPCPYDYDIYVSGTETQVTEAYTWYNGTQYTTTYTGTHYAVLAMHPDGDDPSRDWDNRLIYEGNPYTFPDGAQWIWETYRTDEPSDWDDWPWGWYDWQGNWHATSSSVTGRVVTFTRTFTIDCSPRDATLYITADNGYQVWINKGTAKEYLVGSAQLFSGWETHTLTQTYLNTDGWDTVEQLTIPAAYLFAGENTITIIAANEYMNTDDVDEDGYAQPVGNYDRNPAGLIYWLLVEWGDY